VHNIRLVCTKIKLNPYHMFKKVCRLESPVSFQLVLSKVPWYLYSFEKGHRSTRVKIDLDDNLTDKCRRHEREIHRMSVFSLRRTLDL
jgi:hypothetical protein